MKHLEHVTVSRHVTPMPIVFEALLLLCVADMVCGLFLVVLWFKFNCLRNLFVKLVKGQDLTMVCPSELVS